MISRDRSSEDVRCKGLCLIPISRVAARYMRCTFSLNPDRLYASGLSFLLAASCKKFAAKILQQTVNPGRSPPIGIKQALQSSLIPDDP